MAAERVHRAATAVAAWVRRGSRGDAVPLGDTHDLERPARRTRLVRLGLAVALVAALLAAVASIPGPHGRRFLPADTVAMVVLDLSSSIRPTTYKLIGFELASLAKTDQRVGVVVFSDVAYTALPPGTPASELAPFARFYSDDRIHYGADGSPLPRNPWEEWFSAGTSISSGLRLAAQLLGQTGAERGGVILLSDLADDPTDLLRRWRDAMRAAPDELSSTLALTPPMAGAPPSATLLLCHAPEPATTASGRGAVIEPLLKLGTVTAAKVSECRYVDILEDAAPPRGLRLTVRNTLAPTLDDAVVAAIVRLRASPVPTAVAVRSLGGAFSRVPGDATAFAHRDAEAMVVAALMLPDTATLADVERALVPWRAVAALGAGPYVNFQGSATAADLAAAYPRTTYTRLAAIKQAYDPHNRFSLNHNVAPARLAVRGPAA